MLDRVSIRQFQSLRSVDVELKKLTLIVGPSSSGKSAFVRALRTLVSNGRGTSYVTRGAKLAAVSVLTDRGQQVTIERGEAVNRYRVGDVEFSRVGSAVPEQVTTALRIQPEDPLNFAGQFDRPYLLDDSGSQVARVLGELTNVTRIFDAVREANRRRLAVGGELKTRTADVQQLRAEAQAFAGLGDKVKAIAAAEEALAQAQQLAQQRDRLTAALVSLQVAEAALERAQGALPVVPDLEPIEVVLKRAWDFRQAMAALSEQTRFWKDATAAEAEADAEERRLHDEMHQALVDAGVCPTCQQSTKELQPA